MPSVKVNIHGPNFMKWMIVPYAANYFEIDNESNIRLTTALQHQLLFKLDEIDNNILISYDNMFKPTDYVYTSDIDIYEKYKPFSYFTLNLNGDITILYDEELYYKWYPTEYTIDLSMGGHFYIILSHAILYDNHEFFLVTLNHGNMLYEYNVNASNWNIKPFYRNHKKIEHSYMSTIITNKTKLQVDIIQSNYYWREKRGKWYFVNNPNILYKHMDVVDLLPGEYEIAFIDVPFWVTPNNIIVNVVDNETTCVEVAYIPEEYIQSQITVIINGPDEARWYLQENKTNFIKYDNVLLTTKANVVVPANKDYVVQFVDVVGYTTPDPINCHVFENSDVVLHAIYV